MMHVGFETTPVLGAKRQLGDTWTMLKWQLAGKMGGKRFKREGNGSSDDHTGTGALMPPPPQNSDLVSSDGRLRVL